MEESFNGQRGCDPPVEKHCSREHGIDNAASAVPVRNILIQRKPWRPGSLFLFLLQFIELSLLFTLAVTMFQVFL